MNEYIIELYQGEQRYHVHIVALTKPQALQRVALCFSECSVKSIHEL